jgi:hypothetical protein
MDQNCTLISIYFMLVLILYPIYLKLLVSLTFYVDIFNPLTRTASVAIKKRQPFLENIRFRFFSKEPSVSDCTVSSHYHSRRCMSNSAAVWSQTTGQNMSTFLGPNISGVVPCTKLYTWKLTFGAIEYSHDLYSPLQERLVSTSLSNPNKIVVSDCEPVTTPNCSCFSLISIDRVTW